MSNTPYVTPIKTARGLGASKTGTSHHIRQRVSALALIVLVPWFLFSVMKAALGGYSDALAWVSAPLNATLLILTAGAAFYHMRLGMQAVIEDYIGKPGTRAALLILNTFFAAGLFGVVVMSVLSIWTGR
ncbi:MAG: succinate dehydrogenase, hydrophobic membrane anchor protein [Acidobacteria bacterium]|jgi:succinate dehydrogenase / fumarate reductase membrane anchor subunit|nr:succinate dehydrogenase, hydrophobic membrane anchor protein [Acidobacteriota bacterium]